MNEKNFNNFSGKPRILVAPLDWGLGQATRCIPIIHELLLQDCEVLIGAEKGIKILLQKEFPQLTFLPLPGYQVSYSRKKLLMPFKMLMQLPAIMLAVYREQKWLKNAVKKYHVTAVISDNRFGLYHSTIPCVYITHQLLIKTGNGFTERLAQKIHYRFINKYNFCWVPDVEGGLNIAGELSHPKKFPANVIYIGGLSRFEKKPAVEKKYLLLVIISGPEPQRTIFEELLLSQLKHFNEKVLLVRGLPGSTEKKDIGNNSINIINHLATEELSTALQQSEYIISRSGYTTIMDIIKLQQKAILVPTPGQTEQEYLAKYLAEKKRVYYAEQENFSLVGLMEAIKIFPFDTGNFDMGKYKTVIQQFAEKLRQQAVL